MADRGAGSGTRDPVHGTPENQSALPGKGGLTPGRLGGSQFRARACARAW